MEWINNKINFNQNWAAFPLSFMPEAPQPEQLQPQDPKPNVLKEFSPIIISSKLEKQWFCMEIFVKSQISWWLYLMIIFVKTYNLNSTSHEEMCPPDHPSEKIETWSQGALPPPQHCLPSSQNHQALNTAIPHHPSQRSFQPASLSRPHQHPLLW